MIKIPKCQATLGGNFPFTYNNVGARHRSLAWIIHSLLVCILSHCSSVNWKVRLGQLIPSQVGSPKRRPVAGQQTVQILFEGRRVPNVSNNRLGPIKYSWEDSHNSHISHYLSPEVSLPHCGKHTTHV